MPCNEKITISVSIANCDIESLYTVLDEMQLSSVVRATQAGLQGDERILTQERVGEIKKRYAEKQIFKRAKKLGWRVEKQKDGKIRVHR